MGEFRLCENRRAKNPFFHETMSVHLYTIEELCYYMETNLFLLDESWGGEPLFRWLREELKMEKLAGKLHQTYVKTKDLYACVALIFQESGYYTEKELEKQDGLLDSMRGKTAMERRKMRGRPTAYSEEISAGGISLSGTSAAGLYGAHDRGTAGQYHA